MHAHVKQGQLAQRCPQIVGHGGFVHEGHAIRPWPLLYMVGGLLAKVRHPRVTAEHVTAWVIVEHRVVDEKLHASPDNGGAPVRVPTQKAHEATPQAANASGYRHGTGVESSLRPQVAQYQKHHFVGQGVEPVDGPTCHCALCVSLDSKRPNKATAGCLRRRENV